MAKPVAHRNCDSCGVAGATERVRGSLRVWLHDTCFGDRFRVERAFATAAGQTFDPAICAAWGPK